MIYKFVYFFYLHKMYNDLDSYNDTKLNLLSCEYEAVRMERSK